MNKFHKILSFIAIILIGASVFSSIGCAEEANSLQMWYKISTHAYKNLSGWNLLNVTPKTSILDFNPTTISNANGFYIKPDGTSFYYSDYTTDKVYQYNMTTAFDLTTASLYGSISVSSQSTQNTSIYFSTDGTKMYVLNYATYVYQYTLSTAWDITTATYASKSFNVATATGSYLQGLAFSADGTKMYAIGTNSKTVVQYTLSTAWDISTAAAAGKTFSVSSQQSQPYGVDFNSDGTKMYIIGYSSAYVHEYTLTTAWDVSTASYASILFSTSTWSTYPGEFRIANSGNTAYILDYYQAKLIQYTLSTADNISTMTVSKNTTYNNAAVTTYAGTKIFFNSDGTKMYLWVNSNYKAWQFSLSTPYDVSTATSDSISLTSWPVSYPTDIYFSNDGLHMIVTYSGGTTIYERACSTAFVLNTCTTTHSTFSTSAQGSPSYIAFNNSGTKMYVRISSYYYQYTLSTAWVVSSASYDSVYFSAATQTSSPTYMLLDKSGTRMYLRSVNSPYTIFQYKLTTAGDLSTATYETKYFIDGAYDCSNAYATCSGGYGFNANGSILYVLGNSRKLIWQFTVGQ